MAWSREAGIETPFIPTSNGTGWLVAAVRRDVDSSGADTPASDVAEVEEGLAAGSHAVTRKTTLVTMAVKVNGLRLRISVLLASIQRKPSMPNPASWGFELSPVRAAPISPEAVGRM
jgi:hypothetical protein